MLKKLFKKKETKKLTKDDKVKIYADIYATLESVKSNEFTIKYLIKEGKSRENLINLYIDKNSEFIDESIKKLNKLIEDDL